MSSVNGRVKCSRSPKSGDTGEGAEIDAGKEAFIKSIGILGSVLKEADRGWRSHRARRLGAFTLFSVTPRKSGNAVFGYDCSAINSSLDGFSSRAMIRISELTSHGTVFQHALPRKGLSA